MAEERRNRAEHGAGRDILQQRIFEDPFYLQNLHECWLIFHVTFVLVYYLKMSPNIQVKLASFSLWVYFPQHNGMDPQRAMQLS